MTSSSAAARKVSPNFLNFELSIWITLFFFSFFNSISSFGLFTILYLGPDVQALSKIACNRLQKELVEWQVNPPTGFKHEVTDNLQRYSFFRFSV